MSFGITDQGFNRKRESDISAEMYAQLAPTFGVDPSTIGWPPADSPVAQLVAPFARQLGISWEQLETLFQGGDPNQAQGALLDGVLSQNLTPRLEALATAVLAAISGTEGTVVPDTTRLSLFSRGDLFQAVSAATISRLNLLRAVVHVNTASNSGYQVTVNAVVVTTAAPGASPTADAIAFLLLKTLNATVALSGITEAVFYGSATIQVATITNSTLYSVTINGTTYSFTSDVTATATEIRDGLIAAINAGAGKLTAAPVAADTFSLTHQFPGSDWKLDLSARLVIASLSPAGSFAVVSADLESIFTLAVEARLVIATLFSPQAYEAVIAGATDAPAGTLTVIKTPVTGLTAATNFLDGSIGRAVETDDAARVRRLDTLSTGQESGSAILRRLLDGTIKGVTLARVYENITDAIDADSRPAHSVEVLVQGGDDKQIAQAIWNTRGGGIATYGNTSAAAMDSNGNPVTVLFSRPVNLYAWINASLALYSEETFATNGVQAVKDALLAFGNAQGIGKDFLLQRFGGVAVSIPGIKRAIVFQIAITTDPNDLAPIYGLSDIAVSPRQVLVFDSTRIAVTVS